MNTESELSTIFAAFTTQIEALEESISTASPNWFRTTGFVNDLVRWSRLANDVRAFWGFAEDYLNELGVRDRLAVWVAASDQDLARVTIGAIDEIDARFITNTDSARSPSTLRDDELILESWWKRRVPRDPVLAAALATNYWSSTTTD